MCALPQGTVLFSIFFFIQNHTAKLVLEIEGYAYLINFCLLPWRHSDIQFVHFSWFSTVPSWPKSMVVLLNCNALVCVLSLAILKYIVLNNNAIIIHALWAFVCTTLASRPGIVFIIPRHRQHRYIIIVHGFALFYRKNVTQVKQSQMLYYNLK